MERLDFTSGDDVENVPLHMHCRCIVVPPSIGAKEKSNIVITAPLPQFFLHSMQRLGLNADPVEKVSAEQWQYAAQKYFELRLFHSVQSQPYVHSSGKDDEL